MRPVSLPAFGRSRLARSLYTCLALSLLGGCIDIETPDISDLASVGICGDMTLEDLINTEQVSDDCKAQLESYLPQPTHNFDSTLIVLGSVEQADGSLTLYAHGAHAGGSAVDATAWADVEVRVQGEGAAQRLADGEFSVEHVADFDTDLLSIGFVNDYSGSMSSDDLRSVATIQSDMLSSFLPPVYEAEVTQFSSDVVVRQPFTTDRDALLDAVAYDAEFDRQLTALYDGMGTGLESLLERERPLRLLVVSSDGAENDSEHYSRSQLMEWIDAERVPVLMLGALFANPAELRQLAGPRGVYFYTPFYSDARAQVESYLQSLSNMVAITVPNEHRGDGPVTLRLGGAEASSQ